MNACLKHSYVVVHEQDKCPACSDMEQACATTDKLLDTIRQLQAGGSVDPAKLQRRIETLEAIARTIKQAAKGNAGADDRATIAAQKTQILSLFNRLTRSMHQQSTDASEILLLQDKTKDQADVIRERNETIRAYHGELRFLIGELMPECQACVVVKCAECGEEAGS